MSGWRGLREGLAPQRRLVTPAPPPEGIATIYDAVVDVPALSTIVSPRTGSQVVTTSDGMLRVWDGSVWRVRGGRVATWSALSSIVGSIETGAIVGVGADLGAGVVRVRWSGSTWQRVPAGTPLMWAITSVTQADPSGLGLVVDGDGGILTIGTERLLLRFAPAVPIAVGAGGGTLAMWVPPEAYGVAGLTIDCYGLGAEDHAALNTQALQVSFSNTGTVSAVGGYIRLLAPTVGSGNSVAMLTCPTITGARRFWLTCEMRGTVTTNGAAGLYQTSTESTQYCFAHSTPVGAYVQPLYWTSAWVAAATAVTLRGGGLALPTTTPWLVRAAAGPAITDPVETTVDGVPYCVYRRNADGANTGSSFTMTPLAVGGGAGSAAQLEFRNFIRLVVV